MENGIDTLNEMKEIQNRCIELKKISKKICDETIAKMQELHQYREKNNDNKSILLKEKETFLSLEFTDKFLDNRILTWETVRKNKKTCLEKQEEELKNDQKDIFLVRSTYCDSVYDFLNQPKKTFTFGSVDDGNSADLEKLNKQFQTLEREYQALNRSITEKESSLEELRNLQELHEKKIITHEKVLDSKKQILKDLTQKVKSLKLHRRQYEIESLYHKNSDGNCAMNNENQNQPEIVSSYFLEPEKKSFESSKMLNELYNFYSEKSNTLNEYNISGTTRDYLRRQQSDENEIKRCKISNEVDIPFSNVFRNLHGATSNIATTVQQTARKKSKFVPKQPVLSKRS